LAHVYRLQQYDWPGNVRELQHALEHALIVSGPGQLSLEHIPSEGRRTEGAARKNFAETSEKVLTEAEVREFEKENLRQALRLTRGKVHGSGGAAELLGVRPTTLVSRIQKLGLAPSEFASE
jgi:DNA-binding NtrC family response regulator